MWKYSKLFYLDNTCKKNLVGVQVYMLKSPSPPPQKKVFLKKK